MVKGDDVLGKRGQASLGIDIATLLVDATTEGLVKTES